MTPEPEPEATTDRGCASDEAQIVVSRSAQPLHPVTKALAENLARIDAIRFVRITRGFLQASSEAAGARMVPVTSTGHPTAIGVSLILEEHIEEIQFYEITSAVKGYGAKMVDAVMAALPKGWSCRRLRLERRVLEGDAAAAPAHRAGVER